MTSRPLRTRGLHADPRVLRPVVAADRDLRSVALMDQTRFLPEGGTVSDESDTTPAPPAPRPLAITLGYALAATAVLVVVGAVAHVATQWETVPALAIEMVAGLVFVLATSVLLGLALQRWAGQLARAHDAERRALENLTEVARLRDAFLRSVSHELRTPMTNILGFAQTIRAHHRQLDPQNIEDFADRLVANTARLERLVVDLLELHRREPTDTPRTEPVHVEQLLRAALVATGPREQDIRVATEVAWVTADRGRLERIVGELVGNVVRHTPSGTTAWVHAFLDGDCLELTVEDDGPGLDPSMLDAPTTPFAQGQDAAASHSPGLGIGLSLAVRHAELLGGTLRLEQPDGGGTRVTVRLPARAVTVDEL